MKNLLLTILTCVLMSGAVAQAEERVLPDTNLITSGTEFVILDEGTSEATPMWITNNSSCYTKQKLSTGVYEAYIDTEEEIVYVYRNDELISKIEL